jgi:formate dehydrogenase maturation protein FdhE
MSAGLYITMAGQYCPCCGSTQMSGGSIDMGSGQTSQSISCLHCDARWTDVYVLSNMCDLQPGERKEETR